MIESVIRKHLITDTFIEANMAKYARQPAVFFIDAAGDTDTGWQKDTKLFPRADYVIDWTADHERGASGNLSVEIWCRADGKVLPEEFIDPVKKRLSNTFFKDETGVYCTVWNRNYFMEASGSEPTVSGVSLSFDIMAFPNHHFSSPDPVLATEKFLASAFSGIKVVGLHDLGEVFVPKDNLPIAYVRIESESEARPTTFAVSWRSADIGIHLFCESITMRTKLLEDIQRSIAFTGWAKMDDNSPMRFVSHHLTPGADPLRQGQIRVTTEYGVLSKADESPVLASIGYV